MKSCKVQLKEQPIFYNKQEWTGRCVHVHS